MNKLNSYINRQTFFTNVTNICLTENIKIENLNIIFSIPILAKDYFNLQSNNTSKTIPYTEITTYLFPLLTKIGIDIEYQNNLVESLIILYTLKDNITYIPQKQEDKKIIKFPPGDKLISYEENYQISIHSLYDMFILNSTFDIPTRTIYRIEDIDGNGLYTYEFCKGYGNETLHPSPMNDHNFYSLFITESLNVSYREKWYFGFSTINEAKMWINGSLNEDYLNEYNRIKNYVVLKEITVADPFVILGNKQLIFQKEHIAYEKILVFNLLNIDQFQP